MASRRRSSRRTITGSISDTQRRLKFLEAKPSPSKIGNQAVLRGNIQPRAVGTDQIALNAVVNSSIAPNAVGNEELSPDSVDSENYIDDSIDSEHYAFGSVDSDAVGEDAIGNSELAINSTDSENYIDFSIDTEHYARDSVDAQAIGQDAVGNSELAVNSTDSENYIDFSIDTEHYANSSIKSAAIDADAIENSEMADDSINSAEYVDFSIDREHYANGSIGSAALDGDSVGASELANNSVDTNAIINDAVTFAKIGTREISGSLGTKNHIVDNSIGKLNIGPDAIGRSEIIDGEVTNAKLAGGITQNKFASSVTFPPADGSVTTAKLAANAVTAVKIANGAVTGEKIPDGSIGSSKIPVSSRAIIITSAMSAVAAGTISSARGLAFLDLNRGTTSGQVPLGNHTHPGNNQPPSSSIRFKKDIADYEVDGTKLLNLKAKTFKYKAQHRDQQYGDTYNRPWVLGFIAEEVLEAGIEEVVGYDNKGLPASLRYDLLSVYVVDLLKKHQNEIDSLKEEIQRLKEAK
jgi:uncharacterized protein YciU (UPF0263 family)